MQMSIAYVEAEVNRNVAFRRRLGKAFPPGIMRREARSEMAGSRDTTTRNEARSGPRLLWLFFYFAMAVLGALGALVVTSRRPRFERRWDDLEDLDEDFDDLEPAPGDEPSERPRLAVHSVSVEVDGPEGKLFVDDGGSPGRPVLFVHGLGGSSRQWQAQLAHLRSVRRAVALDLRGHGDSDPVEDPDEAPAAYTLEGYVADVGAVADALDLDRFVLVGHSLGAAVAVEYAAQNPDRVAGLLLVDPNGDQTELPREELDSFLEALEKDPRREMEWYFKQILVGSRTEVADQVLADLRIADEAVFHLSLASSFATSPLPALAAYPGPRLSVVSEMNALPYSLHNLVKDLPWKPIPGTSHWLMMDKPADFNDTLDEFLASVPARVLA